MKKTLLILILLLPFIVANATNYYISSSSGNDQNSGKSANQAWKSIDKLNSQSWAILPGDSILFKCNDTFSGPLIVSRSGNANEYIYYGSYDSGNKPILSGTTKVSNWMETSANIWEATSLECGNKVTNIFINGIAQQIGRYPNVNAPNKGYLIHESHSGKTQITDNELTDAIDWTGAEAVVRTNRWVLDRLTIKTQVNNTLQFTSNATFEFLDNFGYFILNDPRTLDKQGEWYYNPANNKFQLYSENEPNDLSIYATKLDTLLNIQNAYYITVENLHFDGSSTVTMLISGSNHINIRNNEMTNSGVNMAEMYYSDFVIFENNMINHTNNKVISQQYCDNFVMRNNTIKNTGLHAGLGKNGNQQYFPVQQHGNNVLIENNDIDSSGYIGGIGFAGDTILIRNNVISNYAITLDDCGGIYSWSPGTINYSRKLIGNIIYNGIGAIAGTDGYYNAVPGIYMDDMTTNVDIIDNTIFNCPSGGIVIHNANHINIKGNTSYNNGTQLDFNHDYIAPTFPITNCTVDSNIFVSKKSSQPVTSFSTIDNGISDFGNFDNNYYCRPLDDSLVMKLKYIDVINIHELHSLDSWSLKYNKDQNSWKSPIFLEEYTDVDPVLPNLITNGTFNSDINNWYHWSPNDNGRISLAVGEGLEGNALKAYFDAPSGKADGNMTILSNNLSLSKDKTYRMKFAARCSSDSTALKVMLRLDGGDYHVIAEEKIYTLNTLYQQFEYIFTLDRTETNTRLNLFFYEGQGDIWLDSIELIEVNAIQTNPDDYIRFEYNASKNDTTITLTEDYIDVRGVHFSGNITLKPFTSIVLFKEQYNIVCSGKVPVQPDTIIGNFAVCSGTSNTYRANPVSGATYYTWELPNGWAGTSTSNSITTVAGNTGGTISVIARNVCDSSLTQSLIVAVNSSTVPEQPNNISGNTNICSGTSNIYKVTEVSGTVSYSWTLPEGWSGSSTTNSITAIAGTTGGNISVTANNECSSSDAQIIGVAINKAPDAAEIISGKAMVCLDDSDITFSVPDIINATSYIWTLPTGATGTSTTGSILVSFSNTAISGDIKVKGRNDCGDGAESTYKIIVNEIPAPPIISLNNDILESNASNGNQWYFNNNLIQNAINNIYTPLNIGDYYVVVTLNSCSSQQSNVISFTPTKINETILNNGLSVYPNPVINELVFERSFTGVFSISNMVGQLVFKKEISSNKIDLSSLSQGVYLYNLKTSENNFQGKIIKN